MGVSPFPNGKLFEIHGNELKPDPVGNLGQASVLSIPHGVLLFGVRKDAFDGLLAPLVQVPIRKYSRTAGCCPPATDDEGRARMVEICV